MKTEFVGGNSPNQTKMELTFKELTGTSVRLPLEEKKYDHRTCADFFLLFDAGKFKEEPDQPAARFIRVSHNMEGDMMTSESVKFDWPRYIHAAGSRRRTHLGSDLKSQIVSSEQGCPKDKSHHGPLDPGACYC